MIPISSIAKKTPIRTAFTLAACAGFWLSGAAAQDEGPEPIAKKESYVIAVVWDGDSEYFRQSVDAWEEQLKTYARGYEFSVRRDGFNAGNDSTRVEALLNQALADPTVDVIYAAGVVATERAAKLAAEGLAKPIVAGALQFSDQRGKPISGNGTSNLDNYTFITSPERVGTDLELLRDLTKKKRLHVLIEQRILPELTSREEAESSYEDELDVELELVGAQSTAAATLSGLPGGIEAMYVTLLPGMTTTEREKLFAGLAARGIPTVSMFGKPDVDIGAMAGLAPDSKDSVARLTALNIDRLLRGELTGALPVYLPVQDYLVINSQVAQKAGWSPDYDTVLIADFINEPTPADVEGLTLEEVMRRARANNADVLIAGEGRLISEQDSRIARSFLLPEASVVGQHGRTSFSSKILPAGPDHSHAGTYGAQITQVLFSDELLSNLRAQRKFAEATRYEELSAEYDAMEAAAVAYFNFLAADALYEVEKENLRLTNNNLRMAMLRVDIGAARESEIFRWQQDVARDRATLFLREAERRDALVELNRVMAEKREATWRIDSAEIERFRLGDDQFFFMNEELGERIQRQDEFRKFGGFLQMMAVESSPELTSFDLSLAAQGITLGQRERRFFLPEVAGFAKYDRAVRGSSLVDTDSQNEGTIGIEFSYPLFEGGRRKAEIERQKAVIRQLAAQREKALQLIEQRTLAAVHGIASTHPNIRLSRLGVEAAQNNYDSVEERYSQGAASILDLLDAQRSLLAEKQRAEVANYAYLAQIHQLQRSIAWFEFEKSDDERAHWTRLLETFLKGGTVFTSNGMYPKPPDAERAGGDADRAVERATPPAAPPVPEEVTAEAAPAPPVEAEPEPEPKRRRLFGRFRR